MSKRFLSITESLHVHKFLTKVLKKRPDGYWQFINGYNDIEVALELGHGITEGNVRSIRKKAFGIVRKPSAPKPLVQLSLEDRVAKLEAFLVKHGGYKP